MSCISNLTIEKGSQNDSRLGCRLMRTGKESPTPAYGSIGSRGGATVRATMTTTAMASAALTDDLYGAMLGPEGGLGRMLQAEHEWG